MNTNILERFKLDGKVALVTGAGRGLGKAFAHALADAGADVAIADIIDDNAEMVCEEIKSKNRNAVAIHADISKKEDAEDMVKKTVEALGGLDILVANAGMALPINDAENITEDDWNKLMDVNLKGTFFCSQAAAKEMVPKKYGKIIIIGSICAHIVWPEAQSVYSISKALKLNGSHLLPLPD